MRYLDFAAGQADPRGQKPERLILAIDASPSMDDTDWPPSRLAAAIAAAVALIARKLKIAPDDEVGIVAYASKAWWVAQPAVVRKKHTTLRGALSGIRTRCATNITSALQLAGPALRRGQRPTLLDRLLPPIKVADSDGCVPRIVILSDGFHNTGDSPRGEAKALKKKGVCIDCVGIGGKPSDVDEKLLKAIASTHADGVTPRYTFIGDKGELIEKFEELAGRITR